MPSSKLKSKQLFVPTTQYSKNMDVKMSCNSISRTNDLPSFNSKPRRKLFPRLNLLTSDKGTQTDIVEFPSSHSNSKPLFVPTTDNLKKKDIEIPSNNISQLKPLPSFDSLPRRKLFPRLNLLPSDKETEKEIVELPSSYLISKQLSVPTTNNFKKIKIEIPCNNISQTNALPSFNILSHRKLIVELSSSYSNSKPLFVSTTDNLKKIDIEIPCNNISPTNALPSSNSLSHKKLFSTSDLSASNEDAEKEIVELPSLNLNVEQLFMPTTDNLKKIDIEIPYNNISPTNALPSSNSPSHKKLFPTSDLSASDEDAEKEIVELPSLNLNVEQLFVPTTDNLKKIDIEIPYNNISPTNALPSSNSLSHKKLFPTSDLSASDEDAEKEIAELPSLNLNVEQLFVPITQHSNASDSTPSKSPSPLFVDGEIPMFSHTFITFLSK